MPDEDEALPPPVVQGTTLARTTPEDTDRAADFCLARPTPSRPEAACLDEGAPGDVWINELTMGIPDSAELTLGTATSVDLLGWKLIYDGGSYRLGEGAMLTSRVPYVLVDDDSGVDSPPRYRAADNIDWAATEGGFATIEDAFGNPIDFVRWGDSTQAVPAGLSFTGSAPAVPDDASALSRQGVDDDRGDDFCITSPTPLSDNAGCE